MECGVEPAVGGAGGGGGGGMLNVGAVGEAAVGVGGPQQPLSTGYTPPDTDQAQFEADKRAVYKHPLFPLLALLFERCELATQSSDAQSSDAFNLDIQAFVQHQERDRKPFLANEPEIDGLMIKAIQVLRIHLLELEKVQELCKDFCNRYITCLKGKMQSENLLRSDYTQGPGVMTALENNNNMLSHGNSESGSDSNSPVQYSISPTQQGGMVPGAGADCLERPVAVLAAQQQQQQHPQPDQQATAAPHHQVQPQGPPPATANPLQHQQQQQRLAAAADPVALHQYQQQQQQPQPPVQAQYAPQQQAAPNTQYDPHVVHGSTPLGQIGVSVCPLPVDPVMSGQLSPAPTTPGGSADDCDSDFTGRIGSKKQKRGVLPKHATSVMRSWLFQHLVHPYPTEDEKRHIAAQTSLTLLQVNNWFINARRRILQPMLDAGGGGGGGGGAADGQTTLHGGGHGGKPARKKPHNSSSRRFWPQDIAALQPQLPSGVLSSSDDDCSSYSSDGEEGSLVIDSVGTGAVQGHHDVNVNAHRNGHHPAANDTPPATAYSNSSAESTDQP